MASWAPPGDRHPNHLYDDRSEEKILLWCTESSERIGDIDGGLIGDEGLVAELFEIDEKIALLHLYGEVHQGRRD